MLTKSSITEGDPNLGPHVHVHAARHFLTEPFLLPTSPKIDLTIIKALFFGGDKLSIP